MTLEQIYDKFTPGSKGFVKAVQTWGGLNITDSEIERLGFECPTWQAFKDDYENYSWWTDYNYQRARFGSVRKAEAGKR